MITDALIKKLDLRETQDTLGLSRLYNLRIFTWPDMSDAVHTTYFMECEIDGTPAKDKGTVILLRGPRKFKWCRVANELLNDSDQDQIMKIMQHMLSKSPDLPHYARTSHVIKPNQKPKE